MFIIQEAIDICIHVKEGKQMFTHLGVTCWKQVFFLGTCIKLILIPQHPAYSFLAHPPSPYIAPLPFIL